MLNKKYLSVFLILGISTLFVACGESAREYKISLTNLTAAQALAPLSIIIQDKSTNYVTYNIGEIASVALENLAESGSPLQIKEAAESKNVVYASNIEGLTNPGKTKSINFEVRAKNIRLDVLSMLVSTNDAFIGKKDIDLDFNGKKTFFLNVYDAGSEKNDELTSTVPGLGGEGFSSIRNDINNFVSIHTGIISKDDGLLTSGFNSSYKWDNPAASITIERIK